MRLFYNSTRPNTASPAAFVPSFSPGRRWFRWLRGDYGAFDGVGFGRVADVVEHHRCSFVVIGHSREGRLPVVT
jgi:hypothetical protein